MTGKVIRALIVDDDAAARNRLRSLLESHDDVRVVQECEGGRSAVSAVRTEAPNLVFLDVEMPDLDGFGVITEVGAARMPPIVFTSAYSQYAVRAFEAYALDYLLKPFDGPRLAAAIDRARQSVHSAEAAVAADPRVTGLLDHLERELWEKHPESIAIKSGDKYTVIPLADVDWIEAHGNYSRVYVGKRPRLLTKTLATLEKEVLDPDVFVRVHRSAIVNTKKITSVEPDPHGDAKLILHDGTSIPCSRRYRDELGRKIYFST
ncbi:MAG TPA: LytTR family DNA-binding domain-containing protein [Gemmatimonadaceae bacterium]